MSEPYPNLQITFRDDLTQPEQRQAVERSVHTLVARSQRAVAQRRAAEAERRKLQDTVSAPFLKLIKDDPAAANALEELRTQQDFDLDSPDVLRREQPLPATNAVVTVPLREAGREGEARVLAVFPPYGFTWSWFDQAGKAPFNVCHVNASGRVGFDARSGICSGCADGFVQVHAGFGEVLRTNSTMTVTGLAQRRMRYSYVVEANGVGANATSEGGMELTALEDGRLLTSATAQHWRRRVSGALFDPHEYAQHREEWFEVTEPRQLKFTMHPGREYTFNVGIWGYTDRSGGLAGVTQAQSIIEAEVLHIAKTP